MGLDYQDLASAIHSHPSDLNQYDCHATSPLDLAVKYQNSAQVEILLRSGASPSRAFSEAMYTGNLEIVRLFLNLIPSPYLICPLREWGEAHHYFGTSVHCLDELMLQSFNVNEQDKYGSTILIRCFSSRDISKVPLDRIEWLINHRADVNAVDIDCCPALFYSIGMDHGEATKLLFRRGARLDIKNVLEETILHFTILFAREMKTIETLREMDLRVIDLQARTKDGHTALDLLKKRNGLGWETYYRDRHLETWRYSEVWNFSARAYTIEEEIRVIYGLEALLHQIQDAQGVPKEEQYPPLGEYLSSNLDDEQVPGAWPF